MTNPAEKVNRPKQRRATVRFSRKLSDADSRIRQADRLSKPLRILRCVQTGGDWTKARFAEEFECSQRTVDRYVDVLKYAGVPIYFDRERKSYRLFNDAQYPQLDFSRDEILGQARQAAIGRVQEILPNILKGSSSRRMASTLSASEKSLIDEASELVSALNLKTVDHSALEPFLNSVQLALIHKRMLGGVYLSPFSNESKKVVINPIRLCFIRAAWYLIAKPQRSVVPRTYRLVRFQTLRILDEAATVPPEFDLRAHFGNAWSVWRGEKSYEIEILFASAAASIVAESKWHHTQRVEKHTDNSATLTFTVDGLDEIIWWLLSWAPFAMVKRPSKLKIMLVDQLKLGIAQNSS